MFKYEQQDTIAMFNRKLEDFIVLRDRIEGDNYHMSPNDEGFTEPHEEYMWAKMNIAWLNKQISEICALTPYPDTPDMEYTKEIRDLLAN